MESRKTDRRIKYTKSVLRQSLLALMRKTDVSKITVTDICRLADINRGTFYKYYSDPAALLKSIEDELYESISAAITGKLADGKRKKFPDSDVILQVITCIYENSDICRALLGEYGDMEFLTRVLTIAQRQCEDEWFESAKRGSARTPAYIYAYTVGGCLAVLRLWITEGMEESPGEIASVINGIVQRGLSAFL